MAMDMIPMNVVNTMQGAAGSAGAPGIAATAAPPTLQSGIKGGEELPGKGGTFVAMLQAVLAGEKGALSALHNGFAMEKGGKTVSLDSLAEKLRESGEAPLDGEVAVLVQQLMAQMQTQGAGVALPMMQSAAPMGTQGGPARPGILSDGGDTGTVISALAGGTPAKRANVPGTFFLPDTGPNSAQKEAAVSGTAPALQSETSVSPGGSGESGAFRLETAPTREAFPAHSALPEEGAVPLKAAPPESPGKDSPMLLREMQAWENDTSGASLPAAGVKPGNDSASADTDTSSPATVSLSAPLSAESRGKSDPAVKEALPLHRVNELGEAAAKAAETGTRNLIIKLDPPELGSIQIKLRMENGVLTADIRVESPAVKDLFSLAVPQIRASLEDSGIRVGEMWVDHKEDFYSDGRERQGNADQQRNQQQKQDREEHPRFFEYFA